MFRSLNGCFIQKTYSFSEVRKYFPNLELAGRRLVGLFLRFLRYSNGLYQFCKIFATFYPYPPKNTSNYFKVSIVISISFTISPLFKTTIRSQNPVTLIKSWLETSTVTFWLAAKSLIIRFQSYLCCLV